MDRLQEFVDGLCNKFIQHVTANIPKVTVKKEFNENYIYNKMQVIVSFGLTNIGKLALVFTIEILKRIERTPSPAMSSLSEKYEFHPLFKDGDSPNLYYHDQCIKVIVDSQNLGSDVFVEVVPEAILYKKSDFGGYGKEKKLIWNLRNIKSPKSVFSGVRESVYYEMHEISIHSIFLDVVQNSGEFDRSMIKSYGTRGLLNDFISEFKDWKEVKKVKTHPKDPIQTRILEEVKEMGEGKDGNTGD